MANRARARSRYFRVVSVPLEDVPIVLAPYGLAAPASWLPGSTSRFLHDRQPVQPNQLTFLRLGPTSKSSQSSPRWLSQLPSLSQGLSPQQRHPFAKSHHSRVLPSRVTLRPHAYHAPRRLISLGDLPGVLSTRRAHGVPPTLQSLTEQRSSRLSTRPPLMRFARPSPMF